MSSCTACGHRLGVGRFCAHCGAATDPSPALREPTGDWRTDTAERALPRTPPSASASPLPPRYPLFADEVDRWSPDDAMVTRTAPQPAPEPAQELRPEPAPASISLLEEPADAGWDDRVEDWDERRSPWRWIVVTVLVLALVAGAWWFLVRDGAGSSAAGSDPGSADSVAAEPDPGVDVAAQAEAEAPRTAEPNNDVDGSQVTFDAVHLVDGDPTTAWRAPGAAVGLALTFTLDGPTELTRVGLVNGYAKSATDEEGVTHDWYAGNRRVTEVVWVFPGGTTVRQSLTDQREPQLLDLDEPITTGKVVLRIAKVSAPGTGPDGRDFTAISEVSLIGTPAAG